MIIQFNAISIYCSRVIGSLYDYSLNSFPIVLCFRFSTHPMSYSRLLSFFMYDLLLLSFTHEEKNILFLFPTIRIVRMSVDDCEGIWNIMWKNFYYFPFHHAPKKNYQRPMKGRTKRGKKFPWTEWKVFV